MYGCGPHRGPEYYGYDNADRITAACYGDQVDTCPTGSLITYAYDKVGNRSSQTKFGTTTNYGYDAADQLTQTTSGGNTTTYSYDNDGQQTAEGTKTYAYDLAGQLTQVANNGTPLASFTYDGAGNRLTKTASSVTTSYWWDENNDLPMLALESQGGSTLRDYLYGDRLLSISAGSGVYYFHHDALGTTAAISKQTGATEWTYTYDPYGVNRITTKVDPTAPDNPIQYTGGLIDSETGLYDLRARTYNPADGNFLTTDPLAQNDEDPALSIYLYSDADPLLLTDPSGERPLVDTQGDFVIWMLDPGSGDAVVVFGGTNGGGPATANQVVVNSAKKLVRAASSVSTGRGAPLVTTRQLSAAVYATEITNGSLPLALLPRIDRRDLYFQLSGLTQDLGCPGYGGGFFDLYCDQAAAAREQAFTPPTWAEIKQELAALSGWDDLVHCAHGSAASCGWSGLAFIPILGRLGVGARAIADLGRLARLGRTAEDANLGSKLDFLFGRATGSEANVTRSVGMQRQLARIGIQDTPEGRAYVAAHLIEVAADRTSVARIQPNGRVVRESLLMGPGGAVKVESIWQGNRLITAKLYGARG